MACLTLEYKKVAFFSIATHLITVQKEQHLILQLSLSALKKM